MSDLKQLKSLDGGAAVGAYLRFLREEQGLQAIDIANEIGTDQTQVWRIEKWKSDTRSTLLFKFIKAVGGSAEDVEMLINNPNAKQEDGITLARLRLALKKH